jgi:hypothetical protein
MATIVATATAKRRPPLASPTFAEAGREAPATGRPTPVAGTAAPLRQPSSQPAGAPVDRHLSEIEEECARLTVDLSRKLEAATTTAMQRAGVVDAAAGQRPPLLARIDRSDVIAAVHELRDFAAASQREVIRLTSSSAKLSAALAVRKATCDRLKHENMALQDQLAQKTLALRDTACSPNHLVASIHDRGGGLTTTPPRGQHQHDPQGGRGSGLGLLSPKAREVALTRALTEQCDDNVTLRKRLAAREQELKAAQDEVSEWRDIANQRAQDVSELRSQLSSVREEAERLKRETPATVFNSPSPIAMPERPLVTELPARSATEAIATAPLARTSPTRSAASTHDDGLGVEEPRHRGLEFHPRYLFDGAPWEGHSQHQHSSRGPLTTDDAQGRLLDELHHLASLLNH